MNGSRFAARLLIWKSLCAAFLGDAALVRSRSPETWLALRRDEGGSSSPSRAAKEKKVARRAES